jgi:nucleotide-binding universal stress UspA family protein
MPSTPTDTVVVPLDGSTNAELALPLGALFARKWGVPLRFVHVADPERLEGEPALGRATEVFRTYVAGLLNARRLSDLPWHAAVECGPAARVILDAAQGARLIAIATHGRSGLHATFVGSVTDKVIRAARIPVLAVPIGSRVRIEGDPVVVGVDGSTSAEAGLELAREVAGLIGSRLVIVRAYNIPAPGVDFVAYPADVSSYLRTGAEEYLAEVARPGEETVCRMDGSVEVLAETASQVDAGLVVLTSHGKGFAQRIALGSTTDRAVHSIRRPLLIVPPGELQD